MENNNNNNNNNNNSNNYPPGYRFMPTDEELIIVYLRKKVNNEPIPVAEMSEVNLYKFTPKYLTENYPQLGDKEWYFYTPRDRKYPNGNRPKRSVEGIGYWKATGADKLIRLQDELIGKKKVLVFYLGKPKSNEEKTNWIMHEYKLNTPSRSSSNNNMRLDDWVLCRIYEKPGTPNRKRKAVEARVPDNVDRGNNLPSENNNNDIEDVQALRIQNSLDAAIDHHHDHNRHGGGAAIDHHHDHDRHGGGAAIDQNYNHNNAAIDHHHDHDHDLHGGGAARHCGGAAIDHNYNQNNGYGDNLRPFPQQFPASYNYQDGFSNQPLHRIVSGPGHPHEANGFGPGHPPEANGFVYGIPNNFDYDQQQMYFPNEQQASTAWDGDLHEIWTYNPDYASNSIFPIEDCLRPDGEGCSTKYLDDEQLERKRRIN